MSVEGWDLLENQPGMNRLRHLSPDIILFCIDGTIMIIDVNLCGISLGKMNLVSSEYVRYSCPEMTKREIRESTEKSVVSSLGMIIYRILNQKISFDGISQKIQGR
jgi:hypothetical protein